MPRYLLQPICLFRKGSKAANSEVIQQYNTRIDELPDAKFAFALEDV